MNPTLKDVAVEKHLRQTSGFLADACEKVSDDEVFKNLIPASLDAVNVALSSFE